MHPDVSGVCSSADFDLPAARCRKGERGSPLITWTLEIGALMKNRTPGQFSLSVSWKARMSKSPVPVTRQTILVSLSTVSGGICQRSPHTSMVEEVALTSAKPPPHCSKGDDGLQLGPPNGSSWLEGSSDVLRIPVVLGALVVLSWDHKTRFELRIEFRQIVARRQAIDLHSLGELSRLDCGITLRIKP